MKATLSKEVRSPICAKGHPAISFANSSTRKEVLRTYDVAWIKERRSPVRRHAWATWKAPFLVNHGAHPSFGNIHNGRSSRHRFKKIYRILCARRNRQTHAQRFGNSRRTSRGNGRNDHFVASAAHATNRCLSRIHRDNHGGDFERSTINFARNYARSAGEVWRWHDKSARF